MKRNVITIAAYISLLLIESCQQDDYSKSNTSDYQSGNIITTKAYLSYPNFIQDVEMVVAEYLFNKNFILEKYITRDMSFKDMGMDELQFDSFVRYISMYYDSWDLYGCDLYSYNTVYSFILDVYEIVRPYRELYYTNAIAYVSGIPIHMDFTMSATVWYSDRDQSNIRYATNIKSTGEDIVLNLEQASSSITKITANYKHDSGKYANGSICWNGNVIFTTYYATSETKQELWKYKCEKISFQGDLSTNFYYSHVVDNDKNPDKDISYIEWYDRIERTICRLCGVESISEETNLVQDLHITETKLSEMYDSLYVHYGVNISDEDRQKILTFGDLKHEYTACRNSLLSTSPRLNIDIEDFYDFILDELGYSENENIGPYYRFVEDLGCDSLEVFELCMSIEEEYNIEISEDTMRMFMYNIVEFYNYLTGKDL